MKVLHVITSLLPGGAEKLMVDLLPRFGAMGIVTEIAVFNALETDFMLQLQQSGVKVHRFAPEGGRVYSPANLWRLDRLTYRGGYDILHTHNTAPQLFGAMARRPVRMRAVTTEHNTSNRRRTYTWLSTVDRQMYARYDRVVCISQAALDNLVDFIGADADDPRYTVIPNGIDLSRYTSVPRPIEPDAPVNIVMVAGFREQKDQDTLIRAMSLLPERYRLSLVGDGERRPAIEALIAQLRLGDRVTLAGVRNDIPLILSQSDIVVLSSHYEGLSLSSIEGMASGRPFVASDVAGLHEVVGGSGLLFAEGDHQALARIIERLVDDPQLYMQTASACQRRARDYDIDNTARKYADMYHTLTNDRNV